jgi:chromosome segregation ATPase
MSDETPKPSEPTSEALIQGAIDDAINAYDFSGYDADGAVYPIMDAIRPHIATLSARVAELEDWRDDYASQVDALSAEVDYYRDRWQQAQGLAVARFNEIDVLKAQLATVTRDLNETQAAFDQEQLRAGQLTMELATVTWERADIAAAYKRLADACDDPVEALETAEARAERLARDLREARDVICHEMCPPPHGSHSIECRRVTAALTAPAEGETSNG